ncbi:hypothetical protein FCIRC_102 [Fusarium circinatum]|uniref:Uncharacterized protein n=1 Tax=Fusarium circinatum TaxID=48490 RepID=A0A8H6CU01_FUSCI|nr:hypothetical protein FCIRC_102 [Fusarium circinatum]
MSAVNETAQPPGCRRIKADDIDESLVPIVEAILESHPAVMLAEMTAIFQDGDSLINESWSQADEDKIEAEWQASKRKKSSDYAGIRKKNDDPLRDLWRVCLRFFRQAPPVLLSEHNRLQFVPKIAIPTFRSSCHLFTKDACSAIADLIVHPIWGQDHRPFVEALKYAANCRVGGTRNFRWFIYPDEHCPVLESLNARLEADTAEQLPRTVHHLHTKALETVIASGNSPSLFSDLIYRIGRLARAERSLMDYEKELLEKNILPFKITDLDCFEVGQSAFKGATSPRSSSERARASIRARSRSQHGESSQSIVLASRRGGKVPHRLQGAAPGAVPQAAPKELPRGLKTLFRDLHAALPEEELLLPPEVTPEAPSPVPAQACSGGRHIGVIAGAFTINLPVWMDFERFVVGEDGRDIDAINKEILEPGVAISWEVYGETPVRFLVQRSRMVLLDSGGLSGELGLLPQGHPSDQSLPGKDTDLEEAQLVWQQALAESDLFATRARKAIECFDLWSPMIREMIQKPLGIAEGSLAAWVWDGCGSDERTKRLNVAREVWLSSSSDPRVIRRATKWVQSFVATLQPSA